MDFREGNKIKTLLPYKHMEQARGEKRHGFLFHPLSTSTTKSNLDLISTGASKYGIFVWDDFSQSAEGSVSQMPNGTSVPWLLQLATLKCTTDSDANVAESTEWPRLHMSTQILSSKSKSFYCSESQHYENLDFSTNLQLI